MTAIGGGIWAALLGQTFFGGGVTFSGLALIVLAFVAIRFRKPLEKEKRGGDNTHSPESS